MILQPESDWEPPHTAAEAVFASLQRRLENDGEGDAALYLRHLLRVVPVGSEEAGPYRRHRVRLYQRASDYSARYNAVTGERLSWLFEMLGRGARPGLSSEECLRIAIQIAQPPADAVLEAAAFEQAAADTVFRARWMHVRDGVPVEYDYIQVLVNPATGHAFAHHRKWHAVDPEPTVR
jgi:hypothetical protein